MPISQGVSKICRTAQVLTVVVTDFLASISHYMLGCACTWPPRRSLPIFLRTVHPLMTFDEGKWRFEPAELLEPPRMDTLKSGNHFSSECNADIAAI